MIMKANLSAIAERLRVSKSTVSRALRNHPSISLETRAKVVEAAQTLNYQLRPFRKGRRDSVSLERFHVAVLIASGKSLSGNSLSYQMLNGITDASHEAGGMSSAHFIDTLDGGHIEQAFRLTGEGCSRGVALIGRFDEEMVKRLSRRYPCVSLNHQYPASNVDTVGPEDHDAIVFLVKHLISLGHRRVGFVDVDNSHPGEGRRLAAYFRAITELGLGYDPAAVIKGEKCYPDPESQARSVLETHAKGITAWVCGSDFVAFRLSRLFAENGVRVPEDVSLTGFGGIIPEDAERTLCSMRIPFREIGVEAIAQLLRRIKFPGRPVRHVQLECQFVAGETARSVSCSVKNRAEKRSS